MQGGAELCLDTFFRCHDRERFLLEAGFGCDGPMLTRARQHGVPARAEYFSWWIGFESSTWYWKNLLGRSLFRIRRLARHFRRASIDVVYTNSAVLFEPALAARWAGVPHVWHVHEILTPDYWPRRLLAVDRVLRLINRWSDRVVFESHAARSIAGRMIPDEKTIVLPNPVRFEPQDVPGEEAQRALGERWRKQRGIAPSAPLAAWLGQFSPRKNPVLAVDAFTQCSAAGELVLAGEGPLEADLRRRIAESGRADCIHLLPFQHDIVPVLSAADVLLLTSNEESFGLVLVEAGAFGKPVIATQTQGPGEIVANGETGVLVPPHDVAALAGALNRLFGDASLRRQMGAAGRRRVSSQYSPAAYTKSLESAVLYTASGRFMQ